eukprot:3613244-Prymnesium_polylepis.1
MATRPATPDTMWRESPPCVNPPPPLPLHPSGDACRAYPLEEAHPRVVHLHRLLPRYYPSSQSTGRSRRPSRPTFSVAPRRGRRQTAQRMGRPLRLLAPPQVKVRVGICRIRHRQLVRLLQQLLRRRERQRHRERHVRRLRPGAAR